MPSILVTQMCELTGRGPDKQVLYWETFRWSQPAAPNPIDKPHEDYMHWVRRNPTYGVSLWSLPIPENIRTLVDVGGVDSGRYDTSVVNRFVRNNRTNHLIEVGGTLLRANNGYQRAYDNFLRYRAETAEATVDPPVARNRIHFEVETAPVYSATYSAGNTAAWRDRILREDNFRRAVSAESTRIIVSPYPGGRPRS